MKNLIVLPLFFVMLLSPSAFANGYIKLDGLYKSTETKDASGSEKGSETLINVGAGFITQGRWVIGGLYAMEKVKGGNSTVERTSYGPTLGWISGAASGFYLLGTYFISSEFGDGYKGTGYEVDLGYKMGMGRVSIAPQLSYKSFEYDELNGVDLATPLEHTNIDPYFVLIFEF